ncbi:hypothetical protein [Actinomycetospora termitidis]|uniref:Uncharacterized protein n=1 Tax=Actinomycetospora termitidis TaxID=3053470 RepID=A0ABT7MEJ7_9PSEU|nr:hypothetical protein [Actinomycetospora sp. Odt1-22]MDL5159091.1 hypothetical protein [Actinomycetospora sp. Odt1-22]
MDHEKITARELDEALAEHSRVVVTGPSLVAVRAAVEAVFDRVEGATRDGAAGLLVVPDAPPAVLERLLGTDRRMVLGVRPAVLDAVASADLDAGIVSVEILPDTGSGPVGEVVRAVVDRDRLAVEGPLDETELAALVGREDVAEELEAAIGAGLVVRDGAHLAPAPAVVDLAESAAGWPVTPEFARRLRDAGDPARLVVPGRIAVARGDVGVGPVLLGRLDPDDVPVEAAWAVATAAEERGYDDAAARWHRSVATRGDADDARASRRAAGLAELRCGRRRAARDLLTGIDGADRATQDVLARLVLADATTEEARREARRRFELAADGDDELAASAALALVSMSREDHDDEATVRWLRAAARCTTDRERGVRARIVVIPVLARLGRLAEADEAADALGAFLTDTDPRAWREALGLARAAIARQRGDLDRARVELAAITADVRGPAWAAASVELDVEQGRWTALLDDRPEWVFLRDVRRDRPELSSSTDPQQRLRAARDLTLLREDWSVPVPAPREAPRDLSRRR